MAGLAPGPFAAMMLADMGAQVLRIDRPDPAPRAMPQRFYFTDRNRRSIAVDRQSIPYGTPVRLASQGPVANLQRLVMAQDTGSAIVGAVRADYFAGWGAEAGEFAGRMKQPLRMWVLWPR